jgi:Flp pilus assembly protein TadG
LVRHDERLEEVLSNAVRLPRREGRQRRNHFRASLPIIGFVGAAIDYSRANSVKAAMQTALDATALMLAKEAATDTEDQLKANAKKYFKALFTREEAKDVDVQVTYSTTGGSHVDIKATAALEAQFIRVLGYDTFHVGASSTAKWGLTRLRVALVLDNTGSMSSDGKMTALKTATKTLIDQLHGAVATSGDIYVSIIPFAQDVNLGNSNFAADWIYWGTAPGDNNINNPGAPIQDETTSDDTSWNATRGTCSSGSWSTRSDCFKTSAHAAFRDIRTRIPARVRGYAATGATARKAPA